MGLEPGSDAAIAARVSSIGAAIQLDLNPITVKPLSPWCLVGGTPMTKQRFQCPSDH
ncbi:MAG: hypothetical protein AAF889_02645 [Cyanobacteria bacterium P01_D01_bin.73]